MRDTPLTRRILSHIRNACNPGAPCAHFDTTTGLDDCDPDAVLRHVRRLRDEGLLQIIDVEAGRDGTIRTLHVRGLTPEGEQMLDASKEAERLDGNEPTLVSRRRSKEGR